MSKRYNAWFNKVEVDEYDDFISDIKHTRPNKLTAKYPTEGYEWRLNGKLVAFSIYHDDGTATFCITSEDIGV